MGCSVSANCLNNQNCFNCCFDDDKYSPYGQDIYNPIDRKIKHPIKQGMKDERKAEKAEAKKAEKIAKNNSKNKDRQELLKKAAKSETKVHKTLNSGRISMDGDLKTDNLTLDVKLQSKSKDWTVKHDDWMKVQADSSRAGKECGILIIENKLGETVCVMPIELFKSKFI